MTNRLVYLQMAEAAARAAADLMAAAEAKAAAAEAAAAAEEAATVEEDLDARRREERRRQRRQRQHAPATFRAQPGSGLPRDRAAFAVQVTCRRNSRRRPATRGQINAEQGVQGDAASAGDGLQQVQFHFGE